jgi:hypothetical protein
MQGHAMSEHILYLSAKGCCVSTVGLDEQTILRYIRNQALEEALLEQPQVNGSLDPSMRQRALSEGLHQATPSGHGS